MPFVVWMQTNGRPVAPCLHAADIGYVLGEAPDLPVPLLQVLAFIRQATRSEGPDLPSRVASSCKLNALGPVAEVALGAPSVRDALKRISAFMPYHATHEMLSATTVRGGMVLRDSWGMRMDDEIRHIVHQYFTALVQALCVTTGSPIPVYSRITMAPHPDLGLSHLDAYFGQQAALSAGKVLELFVPDTVADRQLLKPDVERRILPDFPALVPLRGNGTLSVSAKIVIAGMLKDGVPTVERLSAAAGLSVRTMQRRLHREGTSFSGLLDEVRRDLAITDLVSGDQSIGEIAGILGYGAPSSMTRAVRRWTGVPPRAYKRGT